MRQNRRGRLTAFAMATTILAMPGAVFAQAETPDQEIARLEAEQQAIAERLAAARMARQTRIAELRAELAMLEQAEASRSVAAPATQPNPEESEPPAPEDDQAAAGQGQQTLTDRERRRREETENFFDTNFGLGLSLTRDLGDNDRIAAAELDPNGIVRITDEENDLARLMLEAHHFFTPSIFGGDSEGLWGWGPFVAVQPGEGEIIDAVAAGLMVGFRYSRESSNSFNIGIGYIVDPNTQILGEGIVANQPLPEGETEIRFRETSQHGLLIMTSFSF